MSHASSSKVCKYDAFLSFRGKDTRRTFVSHLYNALKQRGIHTFKDDERLETGKTISGELLKAIEEAKFAVVIFSKSYASSRWCLEELAHIIKCKNESEQIVIPVFHDVNPSDVRHQNPPFAKSFSKHEKKYKDDLEKVQRWRDAFAEAGKIAGYHLQNFKDEVDCIKKVVDDIFPKLLQVNPPFPESLVGMKDQVEKVISLLDTKSNDNVRFVGICGMGGIGKTKIATVIFEKYCSEFEGTCFLDVGEGPRDNGIRWLQHALMYELFNEDLNVTSSYKGKNLIRKCHKKKVFIVLDNVNHKEELEALVGGREWFGEGSRILITTRYKRLLVTHMDEGYEVQLLPKHEAVELFRRHAFRSESPKEGFRGFSSQVVEYADGLPLALEVLGSSLYQRDEEEWRRIIARLKKIPHDDILGKLRISFDGLDKEEKRIFLDIACLYSDDSIDYVKRVFDSCDINLQGIKNLVEKSLLSTNRYRSLMHNTIREMGQNIAREEDTNITIWLPEDVRDLFEGKLEAEKVESMGTSGSETHYFKDEVFKKMQRLQVLKIYYNWLKGRTPITYSTTITYLPPSLRWLDWKSYPSSSLPENFEPIHLVGLSLRNSEDLRHLWPTSKKLSNLKHLDLSCSSGLTKTPNFGDMPNLETLNLEECVNLEEVHPSFGHCRMLTYLDLSACEKLKKLPELNLSNLRQLDLRVCGGLTETPNFGDMPNLETLHLWGCKNLEEVHPSLGHCRMLRVLNLNECKKLNKLPELGLSDLKHLNLTECDGLTKTPIFEDMPNLETLILDGCMNLEVVHPSLGHCRMLTYLSLSECEKLKKLPELKLGNLKNLNLSRCGGLIETPNFGDMPNLETLILDGCMNLEVVHPSLGHCKMLTHLNLSECQKLKKLPELKLGNLKNLHLSRCGGLTETPNLSDKCTSLEEFSEIYGDVRRLTRLTIKSTGIGELPSFIGNLRGLTELYLEGCEDLVSLPNNLCNLKKLKNLVLRRCKKLETLPENIGDLQELEILDAIETAISQPPPSITKLGKLSRLNILGGLPEDLGSLQSLKSLDVSGSNISCLPKSIKELLGLRALDVQFCQNLNELPEELPPNLEKLCADYHLALKSIIDVVIKCLKLRFLSISWCGHENPNTELSQVNKLMC